MNIATQYAKALHSLVEENPKTGGEFITQLRAALKRRGHEKLLPQILRAYERLEVGKGRIQVATAVTPERERTRILFELYKKLAH
jgi:hypothetical protein